MSKHGTFDLPLHKHNSTNGARRAYAMIWNREWPHDDDYLRLLAKEVDAIRDNNVKRCDTLLNAMRECHEFEAEA